MMPCTAHHIMLINSAQTKMARTFPRRAHKAARRRAELRELVQVYDRAAGEL